MATHVKVIAALFGVFGVISVAFALFWTVVMGALAAVAGTSGEPDAEVGAAVLGLTGAALTVTMLVLAIPLFIAAWGLWTLRPWARILGIVMAVLMLLNVPLGTIFGIYALVVLFRKDTEALFVR